jgi:hypothetical protein
MPHKLTHGRDEMRHKPNGKYIRKITLPVSANQNKKIALPALLPLPEASTMECLEIDFK